MAEKGEVVGVIQPPPKDADKPVFEIIKPWDSRRRPGSDCNHPRYRLDTEFRVVTCAECGDPLEAFWVLQKNAEWEQRMEYRRRRMEEAERKLLRESLRRYRRLRSTTEVEQAEITALIDKWDADMDDMRSLSQRMYELTNERRWERKRARRATQEQTEP